MVRPFTPVASFALGHAAASKYIPQDYTQKKAGEHNNYWATEAPQPNIKIARTVDALGRGFGNHNTNIDGPYKNSPNSAAMIAEGYASQTGKPVSTMTLANPIPIYENVFLSRGRGVVEQPHKLLGYTGYAGPNTGAELGMGLNVVSNSAPEPIIGLPSTNPDQIGDGGGIGNDFGVSNGIDSIRRPDAAYTLGQQKFDNRFGNWDSLPSESSRAVSPIVRAPQRYSGLSISTAQASPSSNRAAPITNVLPEAAYSPGGFATETIPSFSSPAAESLSGAFNGPGFGPSLAGGFGTAGQGADAPLRGLAKHFEDILANPGQVAAPAWLGSPDPKTGYFPAVAKVDPSAATNGSTSSDAAGNYPRLTSRLASQPRSVFDTGASAVPFAPASQSFSRPGVASVTQPLPTSPSGAPLGLFSGEPMPNWPARLPIFDFPDRSANSNDASDDAPGLGARGTGIPMLDDYIRYINQLYGS